MLAVAQQCAPEGGFSRRQGAATSRASALRWVSLTNTRSEGAKIVEAWRSMDMLSLLQQTGALQDRR